MSHHLPLSPNSPLNKSSLVEPPPNFVPFQRGRATTTAAGSNLGRCSDAGISVSKQPRLTIHPSGGERLLGMSKKILARGVQSLPLKDSLIFDQRPMFATCVTFGSNRCPSKTWMARETFSLELSGAKTRTNNRDTETKICPKTIQTQP